MGWESNNFINLSEVGFDIALCEVDFRTISVRCSDLVRYRKAFRVKIRELMKLDDRNNLSKYIEKFYILASLFQYMYGYHSGASQVEFWQEEVALSLQKTFHPKDFRYKNGARLQYENSKFYEDYLKKQYSQINPTSNVQLLKCIQDGKPFLNLKDYAHFEKCTNEK